jgi:hypothetical protein
MLLATTGLTAGFWQEEKDIYQYGNYNYFDSSVVSYKKT